MFFKTVSDSWISLGRYRISSTRGGGFLNVFLALDCSTTKDFKPSDDMEEQKRLLLTKDELLKSVMNGEFKEAKWTQTVAMSLLWLEHYKKKT